VQCNALCIALQFQLYLFLFNHTVIIDVIAFVKNNDVSIAAVPWDVATKKSSCEQSQPSGQIKYGGVYCWRKKAAKKRLFHGTNLLALGGT
jgi:hypothetical protein